MILFFFVLLEKSVVSIGTREFLSYYLCVYDCLIVEAIKNSSAVWNMGDFHSKE